VTTRLRPAVALFSALTLSACIDSAAPVLTDPQPLLGQDFSLQFFSLRKGRAHDPQRARYVWNGKQYTHAGGAMEDVRAFTVHAFEGGDLIAQSVADERQSTIDYGVVRRLADGVFLLVPVDEDDADEATRAKYCQYVEKSSCRVTMREQLFALARASAAKNKQDGGLVIHLPEQR
jgi:hypothetical protein